MPTSSQPRCFTLFRCLRLVLLGLGLAFGVLRSSLCAAEQPVVQVDAQQQLQYRRDELGNQIPDFSYCGYASGNHPIPDSQVRVTVNPANGDDGQRIQAAIDHVSSLPTDENGFRGAVRLSRGDFQIAGQILIRQSGVVLQGSGATEGGTRLLATGQSRRALIQINPSSDAIVLSTEKPIEVSQAYVPVGATSLELNSTAELTVGDRVIVKRPSTKDWIDSIGCKAFGVGWKPGSRDLEWERTIVEISGNRITVDAPITCALDKKNAVATVQRATWRNRPEHIGVEDLCLESSFAVENSADEDHAWYGVIVDNVNDVWVRRCEFRHFAGGAVQLGRGARCITVEDCISRAPISEQGGYRRHTYFTLGQLTLFNRCWSAQGIHDFSAGHCAAGPNAFVQCRAAQALGSSGPIESWATGVLYDNVRIEGNDLQLENRWNLPPGTGWAAANCVLWQCRAAHVRCFSPPGATNWAIGVWATPAGDGVIESVSDIVRPLSLYQAQLRQRVGEQAAKRLDPILGKSVAATRPTYEQAKRFVEQSNEPARLLVDVIAENMEKATADRIATPLPSSAVEVGSLAKLITSDLPSNEATTAEKKNFSIKNGWLTIDDKLLTGRRLTPSWWRGNIRAEEAATFGFNVSRFAPGRSGLGLTNDLDKTADHLAVNGFAAYEHHYGLWYDRRRDDHLMVKRSDGAVAPPFYEQPFARSGQGVAWDGLSKYDLTKYNPWYWSRMHELAQAGEEKGFLLAHQHFFQHNILEAGAHWVDCPWRPANNINQSDLPEPPRYIGDKRLFMAQHFYDLSNARLRELQRQYIRQCLDVLADCTNVVQMTSAEFTGPLEFMQFWIDTIIEWEREHDQDVLLALSCTKEVQDEILADPERAPHVDIIDIRYWTYDRDGNLYAPAGGVNMAPRQHMSQLKSKPSSFQSITKAVKEYRSKFPDKVVFYNADTQCRSGRDGWAVLMGGGSLPDLTLPAPLASRIPKMSPNQNLVESKANFCLATTGEYLVYAQSTEQPLAIELPNDRTRYQVHWIDTSSNKVVATDEVTAAGALSLTPKTQAVWISRVSDQE